MATGIDQQRLSLLSLFGKRAGLNHDGDDVFVNLAGGMTVDKPASDLGVLPRLPRCPERHPCHDRHDGEVGLAERCAASRRPACVSAEAGRKWAFAAPHAGKPTSILPIDNSQRLRARRVRTVGEALDELLADRFSTVELQA